MHTLTLFLCYPTELPKEKRQMYTVQLCHLRTGKNASLYHNGEGTPLELYTR